mgnify:CR=1 FL=1
MADRSDVIRVVSCLIEDLRYLRQNANTRLNGYSTQFLIDIRGELRGFVDELNVLINRQHAAQTGDSRPLVEVKRVPQ